MRALKFLLSALMAAMLAGCASYHLGATNGAVEGGRSVEILPFNNKTLQPRLGDAITQALRDEADRIAAALERLPVIRETVTVEVPSAEAPAPRRDRPFTTSLIVPSPPATAITA